MAPLRILLVWMCLSLPLAAEGLDEATIRPGNSGPIAALLQGLGVEGAQKSYALVVGVSEFQDFTDLPTANDPIRVHDYLVGEAGFDHVHILTADKVTKARLEELMLDEFRPLVGPNDRFLFYWSGHGVTLGTGNGQVGFLPLADSGKDKFSTMVAMSDLTRWDGFLQARQVLYLLDSCFSGLAGAAPQSDLEAITRQQLSGPSRHMLTAGRDSEQTIAIDALGGSVFTHAVLKGLAGSADTRNALGSDGLVSVAELKAFVAQEVTLQRERFGWDKTITPQLRDLSGSDGAFFFPVASILADEVDARAADGTVTAQGGDAAPVTPKADPEIVEIQQTLLALGFDPGPINGQVSFGTQRALMTFQAQGGLEQSGAPDEPTRLALLRAFAGAQRAARDKAEPQAAASPEEMTLAGAADILEGLGKLDASDKQDRNKVEMALIEFQLDNGLTLGAGLDVATVRALREAPGKQAEAEALNRQAAEMLQAIGRLDPADMQNRDKFQLALIGFQFANGLDPDGEIDPKTFAALAEAALTSGWELATAAVDDDRACDACPYMIEIGGGGFTLGRDNGKPEQGPPATVDIATFALAETEITIEEFDAYIEAKGLDQLTSGRAPEPTCYAWSDDNRMRRTEFEFKLDAEADLEDPVSCVSMQDTLGYIDWLNQQVEGAPFRLPTEAEFEYALTRGMVLSGKVDGDIPGCTLRNSADASSQFDWKDGSCDDGFARVAPVASMSEDGLGLFDMSGNVWEWVADCWAPDHGETPDTDSARCETGTVKGGSFDDPPDNLHPTVRQGVPAKRRQTNIGFRLARDLN